MNRGTYSTIINAQLYHLSMMQEVTNCLKDAIVGAEIKLEFEKDSVSLNIPREGTEVDGWAIQVVTPTVVRIIKVVKCDTIVVLLFFFLRGGLVCWGFNMESPNST